MKTRVATRYARAIYELVSDNAAVEKLCDELISFWRLMEEQSDLKSALCTPVFAPHDRRKVIEDVTSRSGFLGMAPKVLCLLTEAGRIALLLQVAEHLRQLVLESQNIAPLRVESATQLSGDEKKKIEERFRAILGRGVSAFYQTDTALIGGIRATVDGVTYDGTLAAKLSVLREQLVL